METVVGDTIVKTDPIVEVDCGDKGDGCEYCGEARKEKIHGKRGVVKKQRGASTEVELSEGELKGETITCPSERVRPVRAEKLEEPPPPPEPEPDPPVIRDYGYGPACRDCRATRGECHGKNCPHDGIV